MKNVDEIKIDLTVPLLLLSVVLGCLKLNGILDISWWTVTAPIWIFPVVILGILLLALVSTIFIALFENK